MNILIISKATVSMCCFSFKYKMSWSFQET